MIYRFADCTIDTDKLELQRSGAPVAVEPQVLSLLVFLIENRGRVVSRDDVFETVWQGRIVSDATLASRISAARTAVGDTGEQQAIIRTLPRRGFRFVAAVDEGGADADAPPARSTPSQTIRYCTASDGSQLAYSFAGSGKPLVKVANWLNHLEFDWSSPIWSDLFAEFAGYRQLVRYDSRGVGLSDREVGDLSFETMRDDFDTVIAAADPAPFALLGISQGAAIAIDYAVRNPERVTHLILWGGFARGRMRRGNADDAAQSEAFKTLMRQGWGKEESTFRRMFASLYLPDASEEQVRWWTDMQRIATSADNAVRLREAIDDIDVSGLLTQVTTPTLILHSEQEAVAPFGEARLMAARIPDARFVALDSANHLVLRHEAEWQRAVDEIRAFIGD